MSRPKNEASPRISFDQFLEEDIFQTQKYISKKHQSVMGETGNRTSSDAKVKRKKRQANRCLRRRCNMVRDI